MVDDVWGETYCGEVGIIKMDAVLGFEETLMATPMKNASKRPAVSACGDVNTLCTYSVYIYRER